MAQAVESCGGPGLVAPRDHLHRRDLQEGREAHVRPRGRRAGSISPLQRGSGRNMRRAIDIAEGKTVNAAAFKALVKAAARVNRAERS